MKLPANNIKSETHADSASTDKLLIETVARIDCAALGIAVGILFGAGIFIATNFLIFKGGERIGPTLALLNHYFFGFTVTVTGSFVGLIYGFISGFMLGWMLAFLRNCVVKIYLHYIKFKGRVAAVGSFLDS